MNVYLMARDRDFGPPSDLPPNRETLIDDLGLNALFAAMAGGDKFIFDVAKSALLAGLRNDADTILYRQDVLRDCLSHSALVRATYALAVEAIEKEKTSFYFSFLSRSPDWILRRSIDVMRMFADMLERLKGIAATREGHFASEGFEAFFARLDGELGEEYLARIRERIDGLKFRDGILISAELGRGNKGAHYRLRRGDEVKRPWWKRLLARRKPGLGFSINERDESGARALSELTNRGINAVADALARSTDHILGFWNTLRTELGFYVGCMNLYETLVRKGEPASFPHPARDGRRLSGRGLYDACLALSRKERVVGNDVNADGKDFVIITGANQGGKTTFLRALGLSQLMMQSGMFVPAEDFRAEVHDSLFTHFKREEDASMKSGKLDEELARMSDIVDRLTPRSLLLLNESFAATNEREGSEIARQIMSALAEKRIRVFYVTHLYEFARGFFEQKAGSGVFLRAERQTNGVRTFKITEGEPLQTGYGEDLYNKIFGPVP